MNWKPIPFTDRLVVETMEGRKTVTRRPFKIERAKVRPFRTVRPDMPWLGSKCADAIGGRLYKAEMNRLGAVSAVVSDGAKGRTRLGLRPHEYEWVSPWGAAGDGMWVKEVAKLRAMGGDHVPGQWTWFDLAYRADGKVIEYKHADIAGLKNPYKTADKNQPPMFMTRWASRTSLVIKSLRVERLQDITEEDCAREGVIRADEIWPDPGMPTTEKPITARPAVGVFAFKNKWNEIYGPGAWDRNDWVWRIEYALL